MSVGGGVAEVDVPLVVTWYRKSAMTFGGFK